MVRRRAGLAETDDEAATRAKVAATLDEFVPDDDERRWIEPRLLALLGLEDAPAGQREELFAAWRTFFERVADQGPVVMVFEDLHWADSGLIDFIESHPRVVEGPADPRRDPRPPGAPRSPPDLGRRPAPLHRAPPRAAAGAAP